MKAETPSESNPRSPFQFTIFPGSCQWTGWRWESRRRRVTRPTKAIFSRQIQVAPPLSFGTSRHPRSHMASSAGAESLCRRKDLRCRRDETYGLNLIQNDRPGGDYILRTDRCLGCLVAHRFVPLLDRLAVGFGSWIYTRTSYSPSQALESLGMRILSILVTDSRQYFVSKYLTWRARH